VPGTVRQEQLDVAHRLSQLGLTREKLMSIVRACVAGHGGCTDNDPPNARGFESWRWGVRRAREELRPEGWEKNDAGNFSTVINRELKIRLAIMNADDGAGLPNRVPQNRSKKGPNSERVAATNEDLQFKLPGMELWPAPGAQDDPGLEEFSTWHLCVYISGDKVRAELTLLRGFVNGFFTDFIEKIIIVGDGEWDRENVFDDPNDADDNEYEIEVVRK
jgi:hypothetical protein